MKDEDPTKTQRMPKINGLEIGFVHWNTRRREFCVKDINFFVLRRKFFAMKNLSGANFFFKRLCATCISSLPHKENIEPKSKELNKITPWNSLNKGPMPTERQTFVW